MDAQVNFRRGIEVVNAGIVRNNQGKILLVYSKRWDGWSLPGGHVEPGETILESLQRECEEETGLKLEPHSIMNHGELIDTENFSEPVHLIYYHGILDVLDNYDNYKLDEKEHTNFCWVTPTEALKMNLCGNFPELVEKYIKMGD